MKLRFLLLFYSLFFFPNAFQHLEASQNQYSRLNPNLKGDQHVQQVILLKGLPVFHDFEREKVKKKLKLLNPYAEYLNEYSIYYVNTCEPLNHKELSLLETLLNAKEGIDTTSEEGELFLVTPCLGRVSPWSSNVQEVLLRCGLSKVKRIEKGKVFYINGLDPSLFTQLHHSVFDPLKERVWRTFEAGKEIFYEAPSKPVTTYDIHHEGKPALEKARLDLNKEDIDFLYQLFSGLNRSPTDVEMMTFAQVNSEHCRHLIFNTLWEVDGKEKPLSLFEMIKNTAKQSSEGILSAYKDNGAVIAGYHGVSFYPKYFSKIYETEAAFLPLVLKVETHNHPTSISPFPGAATGVGGEIRDEGATGVGGQPLTGLCGFCVSNLELDSFPLPWESPTQKPKNYASALEIMIEGPLGSSHFNNQFGRPNLVGYFRTFETELKTPEGYERRGFCKPIMLAGGMGTVFEENVKKKSAEEQDLLLLLGSPSFLVGLGGATASSSTLGKGDVVKDFASVQRDNPEMQRRCQEVINTCSRLKEKNPIKSIHDVGAGGLSNAVPEIIHADGLGCKIHFNEIVCSQKGMSPLEVWCNESQERYVLIIGKDHLPLFHQIAERENCPYSVIGTLSSEDRLVFEDPSFISPPFDLSLKALFKDGVETKKRVKTEKRMLNHESFDSASLSLNEAASRLLCLPTIGEKTFLINIGDRSVGGLVCRDQMVGPWQVPVSDVCVTLNSFQGYKGQAISLGERAPLSLINHAASARMAVSEALTNIACAAIGPLSSVKLSANWQVAVSHPGEAAGLYEAVHAIGMELCPALGLSIPVGKDSVHMEVVWEEGGKKSKITSPMALNISAFAPVKDVRKTVTPQIQLDQGMSSLFLIDLGRGKNRLGGSCLTQVFNQLGETCPDLDSPDLLINFFYTIQELVDEKLLLAYHDRSDGGLFVTLLEMAFAGHCGLDIALDFSSKDPASILFNEELGAVIQVQESDKKKVLSTFQKFHLSPYVYEIGQPQLSSHIQFRKDQKCILAGDWSDYRKLWAQTTHHIQLLRDNPKTAEEEFLTKIDFNAPGLFSKETFSLNKVEFSPYWKPTVAILREQGTNGHLEMAFAFHQAGFTCVDVHMSDLLSGDFDLERCHGLAICGGFSYGDTLGAGRGWAQTILLNAKLEEMFKKFFMRKDTFTLGVCNGCQVLSLLKELIPGSDQWPTFEKNLSGSHEARVCLVEILSSPSIFFQGMEGSILPLSVSHGEGRASKSGKSSLCLRYVDTKGLPTETYPSNPNGSPCGETGFTTRDGKVTILMPHPERGTRTVQHSWHPQHWEEESPWMEMFYNARCWLKGVLGY